jgi:hypothetical protein
MSAISFVPGTYHARDVLAGRCVPLSPECAFGIASQRGQRAKDVEAAASPPFALSLANPFKFSRFMVADEVAEGHFVQTLKEIA